MQREKDTKTSEKLANGKNPDKHTKKNLFTSNQNTDNDTDPPGG